MILNWTLLVLWLVMLFWAMIASSTLAFVSFILVTIVGLAFCEYY